ncbi:MAG: hypothetical protein OXB99_02405 [Acidimicrobiaceae bacterium]|nr:hypothetical protein [Acidimicrobiaceae bacterium]
MSPIIPAPSEPILSNIMFVAAILVALVATYAVLVRRLRVQTKTDKTTTTKFKIVCMSVAGAALLALAMPMW